MPAKTAKQPKKVKKEKKEKSLKVGISRVKKEAVLKAKPIEIVEKKPVIVSEEKANEEKSLKKEKYYEAVGRRKEAISIVRLYTKKSTDNLEGDHALIRVNDKDYRDYFTDKTLQQIIESPLRKLKSLNRFKATVKVGGGGMSGQADAIKHGLSRTLILFDLNFRKKLKKSGFLTRDSRVKERRKYGLKKARKAPAWSKR